MDSAQMVEGCRRRDAKAQRALYDALAPMVGGVCARYTGSAAEAQDVVQDVFVKVYERIASLDDSNSLTSWVYSLAVNTSIDHLRRRRRWLTFDELEADIPAVDTDPYAMEEVLAAVQRLTPMLRTVFNLCDVEGYSFEEVAKRLGSNNQAVRVALSRARASLKEILKKQGL